MRITPPGGEDNATNASELTVRQTATGYWTVQRGDVPLAGAMTRTAAERELELLERLTLCRERRSERDA
jgi:hypothetical protein